MKNTAEALLIKWINEDLALANEEELRIFYTFIRTYLEEKRKGNRKRK